MSFLSFRNDQEGRTGDCHSPRYETLFHDHSRGSPFGVASGFHGSWGRGFCVGHGGAGKIYDVACELIRLSGLEPHKDIPVVFTGIRPGEKLFEEVLTAEEGVEPTTHPKIFKAKIEEAIKPGNIE